MVIVYRSVKGSNLTPTEVDDNFHDVDGRITTIEGIDLGKSIDSIEVPTGGTTMTITYTDATTDTFVLPVVDLTEVFKGEWQPLTPYFAKGNLITASGRLLCGAAGSHQRLAGLRSQCHAGHGGQSLSILVQGAGHPGL